MPLVLDTETTSTFNNISEYEQAVIIIIIDKLLLLKSSHPIKFIRLQHNLPEYFHEYPACCPSYPAFALSGHLTEQVKSCTFSLDKVRIHAGHGIHPGYRLLYNCFAYNNNSVFKLLTHSSYLSDSNTACCRSGGKTVV